MCASILGRSAKFFPHAVHAYVFGACDAMCRFASVRLSNSHGQCGHLHASENVRLFFLSKQGALQEEA